MTEKRYMSYYEEVLDTWFGYDGNNEPTEREIKEKDYLVIGECKTTDDADNVCKRLNELQKENEQLKQTIETQNFNYGNAKSIIHDSENQIRNLKDENEQLKHNNKMLSMKMSEVSTRYRLLKEFSDDTNPNEAVKTVLHELMMITKEYR